jgi:hypothetical protein
LEHKSDCGGLYHQLRLVVKGFLKIFPEWLSKISLQISGWIVKEMSSSQINGSLNDQCGSGPLAAPAVVRGNPVSGLSAIRFQRPGPRSQRQIQSGFKNRRE